MKPLDVIGSVDFGYRMVWAERRYLCRLAAFPALIKLICMLAILQLGLERQYLSVALVMLPSFFTEGWMLSHLSRLVFLGQRWPFRPTGDARQDEAMLNDRAYGVSAGTLFYVVIKFLMSGFVAILAQTQGTMQADLAATPAHEPSGLTFIVALALMGLTLWGFRYIFLYIPIAVGAPARVVTKAPQSFLLSLQMLGIYLVCLVPPAMIGVLLASTILPPAGEAGAATAMMHVVVIAGQVVIDTLVALISTAAIAHGLRTLMMDQTKP